MKELNRIQQELKAPKNQFNSFGKYKYRSAEDILEAVKPLLKDCILTISDEVKEVAGIPYIQATAQLTHKEEVASVTAQAGISINRKGMDIAQSFGASSSYAKKYALGNLFLLDDSSLDPDTKDNRDANKEEPTKLTNEQIAMIKNKLAEAHKEGNLKPEFFKLDPHTQEELRNYANELRSSKG
jgi:hypothetical protein